MESTLKFQRGDIYFIRLDNRMGSEQSGTRPAVILQNDVGNSCSPTLIVATLTSKTEKKATQPTHCLVEPEGLEPSIVQAEQIFTNDKSRVKRFVGHLTPEEMGRVDDAVKISLALNPMGSIQKLKPIVRSTAAYAPPEVVDGKPPVYPYTPIKSDFEDSCHYNVRHPGQCDGQSGYGVTKLDAIVESIVCTKFSEILECSKSKLLQDMLRKDMEVAQKEVSRAKSELDLKDDERNALKDEMIRVIRGKSSIDRDMIQQLLDENQAAIQAAQDALTAAQNKLEEIEQENKKAENDCSNLFTWASTYQNASFQQRQTILNQFIKEVRVGRDYDIEIILNVPLEEFEEFKSHSLSVRTPSGRKTDLKQAPVRGLGTPNGGIVVFDKTSGEAMNIMPKSSAHVTLRCQDE